MLSLFTVLGAVIFKALVDNNNNNLFPQNITKHLLYLHKPVGHAHLQKQNLRTIKLKINVKATNHKGIHKSLFELPDRRMKIKKIL